MSEVRARLLAGLFMLLAAAPEACPQTAQSDRPMGQVAVRKMGKSGNNGSSRPTGGTAAPLSGLCFQPGIGWQRVLTEQPDASVTRDTNTSMGFKQHGSTGGASPPLVYARLSNLKQAQSVECPEVLTDKKVAGAVVERFTVLHRSPQSRGPTNPGALTSLQAHSPYYRSGRAGLGAVRTLPSAIPPSATDFVSEDGPASHSDQTGDRAFHAYLSFVKLRRLIRNAPDFRTRIKLQQLQDKPAHPSPHEGTQAAGKPLQGERVSRTSSRRSHTHDRSQGNSQSLGVRP
jgi:hypothetical protein